MIRKILVISKKQVFLTSAKFEEERSSHQMIDLFLPPETHWDLLKLLKKANFLFVLDNQSPDVLESYKEIFRLVAPYAVAEADKMLLFRKSEQANPLL